jgi:hypothetical protein
MNFLRNAFNLTKQPLNTIIKRNFSFYLYNPTFTMNTMLTPFKTLNITEDIQPTINQDTQPKLPQIELMNKRNKIAKRKRTKRKTKKQISLRYR